jgi:hypothetical protein
MKTAAMAILAVAASLTGCSRGDPELQLSLTEIKELCSKVGSAAFSKANDGQQPKIGLDWIEGGAEAQCELEYRIKQQEANKPL